MDLAFRSHALEKACNHFRLLVRAHGQARAKLIRRRLDALRAAAALEDLRNAPGRLHGLKGPRKGQLSLDLDGPYRLVFVAFDDPVAERLSTFMKAKRDEIQRMVACRLDQFCHRPHTGV